MDSNYGKTMFGKHDLPASVGITGEVEFVELDGPEAILTLTGKFWHRRGKCCCDSSILFAKCQFYLLSVSNENS